MLRMIVEAAIQHVPLEDEDQRFYWTWENRDNQELQRFFFFNNWSQFSFQQKYDWMMFAQRPPDTIISSSILPIGQDGCVWTVVKKYDANSDLLAVASKEIRIPGLGEFLATAVKKP